MFSAPVCVRLAARHPSVGEVRGLGVFWAVEAGVNPQTREPLAPPWRFKPAANEVIAACKANGMLPFANYNRIHAVPSCNVTDAEVAEGLAILDRRSLSPIGTSPRSSPGVKRRA